jgi:hypothetical protein
MISIAANGALDRRGYEAHGGIVTADDLRDINRQSASRHATYRGHEIIPCLRVIGRNRADRMLNMLEPTMSNRWLAFVEEVHAVVEVITAPTPTAPNSSATPIH